MLLSEPGVETLDPMRPASTPGASKRTSIVRRVRHLPRRDQRELVEQALGVLHDADDRLAALGDHVSPTCRLSSDASPGVRAISFGPVG